MIWALSEPGKKPVIPATLTKGKLDFGTRELNF